MENLTFNELAVEGERLCQSGDYINGIKYFERAINVYGKVVDGNNDDLRNLQTLCIIYNQLGNGYFCLQKYKQALEYHKKDLELSEKFGDEPGMAKACGNIGNTLQLLGDHDEAINYTLKNLEITKRLHDASAEARVLYNLGNIYQSKGKNMGKIARRNGDLNEIPYDARDALLQAVDYYRKTLELVKDRDRAAEGRTYGNLGNTYYLLGDFETAVECHTARLKIAKEFGDRAAERRAYSNLGNAYIYMGKFNEATDFYTKAMNIAKILGDKAIEAQTYYSLGNTYTLLQDYTIAIEYHLKHLQIAKQLSDLLGESRAYWSLGNAYAALGEIENAISYASKHLDVARQIGDTNSEITARMNLYDYQSLIGGYSRESEIGLYTPKTTNPLYNKNSNDFNQQQQLKKSHTFDSISSFATGVQQATTTTAGTSKSINKTNDFNESSFFDAVSRIQSNRLDDQRCSFRLLPQNINYQETTERRKSSTTTKKSLIANKILKEDEMSSEDLLDLIMKCQSTRLEDQRSNVAPRENNENTLQARRQSTQPLQTASQKPIQKSQQGVTIAPGDEDFFSFLQKVQSRRLDEQRSEIPMATMGGTARLPSLKSTTHNSARNGSIV